MGTIVILTTLAISIIIIILGVFLTIYEKKHNIRVREKNLKIKSNIQDAFSQLSIGTPFSAVVNRFRQCEAISAPNLVLETMVRNGNKQATYIWYLDWDYIISKSSGVVPYSTYESDGSLCNRMSYMQGATTQKAFIQIIFENDKLVAKEQKGLYQ